MNDVPFHMTRTGRQYYEATLPELVRQLSRLNDLLARYLDDAAKQDDAPADEEPTDVSS